MTDHVGCSNAELPPSVKEALEALRPVPEMDPASLAAGRQAFLVEAHELAASRPWRTRWLNSLAFLFGFGSRDAQTAPMSRTAAFALRFALILLVLLGGSVGTVNASRVSLPGSPLYSLKVRMERWEMNQVREPEAVTARALSHAQQRVDEAARLRSLGKTVPREVAMLYRERLNTALEASQMLSEAQRLQAQIHISLTLRQQLQTLSHVAAQVEGEQVDDGDDGVQALIQAGEEAQARLGDHEGDDHNGDVSEERGDATSPDTAPLPSPERQENVCQDEGDAAAGCGPGKPAAHPVDSGDGSSDEADPEAPGEEEERSDAAPEAPDEDDQQVPPSGDDRESGEKPPLKPHNNPGPTGEDKPRDGDGQDSDNEESGSDDPGTDEGEPDRLAAPSDEDGRTEDEGGRKDDEGGKDDHQGQRPGGEHKEDRDDGKGESDDRRRDGSENRDDEAEAENDRKSEDAGGNEDDRDNRKERRPMKRRSD